MYRKFFGLNEMPFSIAPDPRYLYMSEQHREALAHLIYGINSDGGFVLLTGEVGTGKTTVCRCLLEQIPKNSKIAFILNPKLTVEELLATICDEFGIYYPEGNTSIKVFVDLINAYLIDVHAKGYKTVLIIDEAQNLSDDVLEQLRLLTNLETNQYKLLQIILLGQPELKNKLSQPELQQLAQRIIARYHLGSLSKKDVAAYVTHRLAVAGLQKQLFLASTIGPLFRLSGGVPRVINMLCDRALLGAFVQGKGWVNKSTLTKAAREVLGQVTVQEPQRKTYGWVLAGLLVVFVAVLTVNYYNYESQSVVTNITEPPLQSKTMQLLVDQPKLDTLQWLADQPNSLSKDMAYQALFKPWGINYLPHEHITACEQAQVQGLLCLTARGSLNSLRHLNRPAVLKLFDNQGQKFYATLTALRGQTAFFVVGTETKKVDVQDLALQWFGDYILLWRMPPEYHGNIRPGYQGPVVEWLDKQLALIQGRTAQAKQNLVFDDALVKQVKEFQLAEGLVPDGIVGTQTLIHLNTAVGSEIPKLIDEQRGN